MQSFCIKTNNVKILEYLQTEINSFNFEDTCNSRKRFKIYNNIIVHYTGKNNKKFVYTLSLVLANCIEKFFENKILKKYINYQYFYFEDFEQDIILEICERILKFQEEQFEYKKEILKELLYEYLLDNKNIILEGIVNFRIREYIEILEYVVEIAVSNYIRYL